MEKLDLYKIRQEIDQVDKQLAEVLEKRLQLVLKVAEYKQEKGIPVKDANREEQVIAKVTGMLHNQEYGLAVAKIMRSIIDVACSLEEELLRKKGK